MDSAVKELAMARLTVMESRQNGARYSLSFMAPRGVRVEKYVSGQYSYYSDAKAGLEQAVASLKANGKVLIETRLNGAGFTLSYLDGLRQDSDWTTRRFSFQSGSFSYYSDAKASLQEAVEQLREVGCDIYESRLNGSSYTLVFDGPARSAVQNYASGQYSFFSEAKNGMAQTVRSLESRGNVILEARLNGSAFTVSYLTSYYQY
ncbi:MAG: hypothetical protein A3J79_08740 [Elusimicrobia bacterium RIFOXYB2_FULL_62_6]|nr:MAG: hypothetical protein A3J79_08740 [Elusimicrobia bacterium RIFOXYB2_FULL_62_6]